ncbi:MAG: type IX secretion system membrane protein PorP/SprF [Flavobacterium sp.]|nr:MAG: type IX secretion system membrane protein PorP/SprF [Flavobacterium sp.]
MNIQKKIITSILLLLSTTGYSQLNPMGSMYYQNQYIMNPAMAGKEEGAIVSGGLKAQFSSFEGMPFMQYASAELGIPRKNIGLGLYIYNESAGAIKRPSLKASYSYHLALNRFENQTLSFGLSLGIMDEFINYKVSKGNLADASLLNFDKRPVYFDGDFGLAYQSETLTLQACAPNIKQLLKKDVYRNIADRALYFTSVSYKFYISSYNTNTLEPKIVYRGVQNTADIYSIGTNFKFYYDKLDLSAIYHSTNSITFGMGTLWQEQLSILCQYTTNTSELQSYNNGEFEISLRFKINK